MKDVRRLLVVDDDALTRDCFRFLFPRNECAVTTVGSASEGLTAFTHDRPDVVFLDVRLPDLSGLEAFQQFQAIDARVPVVLVTGHGTADTAIEAMRLGAYEYVVKPLDPAELRQLFERAYETSRLMRVPATMETESKPTSGDAEADGDVLIGHCPAMQNVYKAIGRVASKDVTVLVLGESGTGKELVARAIYHYSDRAKEPFLAINCAAIPEALLESELFGHEKGAFTGAGTLRIGKFEQCNKGTLFLDEIGDMTPLTQAKMLRVLQDRQFQRVGGNEVIQTDVRIITATNQNLESRISSGQFRSDLFYRIGGFTISLPPLRERGSDLDRLVEHFVRRFQRSLGKEIRDISPEAMDALRRHPWPGNIRELQGVLRQAILQATGPVLTLDCLPQLFRLDGRPQRPTSDAAGSPIEFPDLQRFIQTRLVADTTGLHGEFRAATERQLFLQVLEFTHHNLSQAARLLGISRATLRNNLAALGITIERSAGFGIDE